MMRTSVDRSVRRQRGASGFTLIEIVAVTAIGVLTVSIAWPSLSQARMHARRTMCQANLRSVGTAWWSYFTEFQGRLYQSAHAQTTFGGKHGADSPLAADGEPMPRPLNPFVGLPRRPSATTGAELFHCPADRGGALAGDSAYDSCGTSYITNPMLIGKPELVVPQNRHGVLIRAVNQRLRGLRLNAVSAAHSRLVLAGEYGWFHDWNPQSPSATEWHSTPHHFNLAFLDGHVEFVPIQKGAYLTKNYRIIPFKRLDHLTMRIQETEGIP